MAGAKVRVAMRWVLVVVAALLVGGLIGFAMGRVADADQQVASDGPLADVPMVVGLADEPYDRAQFGQRWADIDRNGCDTRNDILGRDLLEPTFKPGTNDCKVLGGVLIDPYDGRRVEFVAGQNTSARVQIDHVVALSWAWHHGADAWTDERRIEFANDPRNLLATSEAMNQQKAASGPAGWLPPGGTFRCEFVQSWVEVVFAYGLGINADDRRVAESVLRDC